MTFFQANARAPRRVGGIAFMVLFVLSLGSLLILPTGYVIERPGQTFNVMSEVDSNPVISSQETEIYESDSRFDVLTISLVGNRESGPSWLQVIAAWADPEQLVLPIDEVYPPNRTTEEIKAESVAMMEVSQQDAIAAALIELGYEVPRNIYVNSVLADSPSSGAVIAGDFVRQVNDVVVADFAELRSEIQKADGAEIRLTLVREGALTEARVTPIRQDDAWVVGVMVGYTYDFPFQLDLQLGNVGGPSGGMIFSIGIIDALTPGSLADELHVAGTGTISPSGAVGPIGGIALKMIAAQKAGADLFIGPRQNCDEIVGKIPDGLTVVAVRDLSEALSAIEAMKAGQAPNSSLSCTAG